MSGLRDYEQWHRRYDDPTSDLSWRLRTVQGYLRQALDRYPGPIRILSCCDSWPAVGVVRYDGPPVPLPTGKQLFTFLR